MSKTNDNGAQEITFLLPDISGFTRFLKSTEISHSRHIIEELITILVQKTKGSFQIAEVEGDALFLYQDTSKLSASVLYDVVKKTYIAFHEHLVNYDHLRICNCGACSSATNLSLKFIAHTGKVEFAKVNGKEKPYGLDVIKAHRLMKNNIEGKDYLLFSEDFSGKYDLGELDEKCQYGSASYDEIGEINYSYLRLLHLKEAIKPADDESNYAATKPLKTIISETIEIDAPVNIVYEVLSDFKYRPVWNKDAKIVDHNDKDIYRVGSEHYCIINNKKFKIKTIGNRKSRFEFGEQVLKNGPFKELNLYFIFNKLVDGTEKTTLTIEIRAKFYPFIKPFIMFLMRPSLNKKVPEMLGLIKDLSEGIHQERIESDNQKDITKKLMTNLD